MASLRRIPVCMVVALVLVGVASLCLCQEKSGVPHNPRLIPSPSHRASSPGPLYPTWWGDPPTVEETVPCKDAGTCANCHESTSSMDPTHAFACVRCHHGDPDAGEEDRAHAGLIAEPGDLNVVDRTCGVCHKEETRRVKRSAMALAPRMIAHTRFAFGAQPSSDPTFATVALDPLRQIPHPSRSSNLGDDLLRRSCLRCHLHTRGSSRWGEHRGLGCIACHVAYPNSRDGRPRAHALTRSVGMTGCLKCHNSNHVGADYVGLFEKDFQRGFNSPFVQGRQPPTIYGSEQHRLISDVHFQAGMGCMDCHTLDEVHGTGEVPRSPVSGVRISCEGCHVRGDHPAILKDSDGVMTLLRGTGRKVPPWDPASIPHRMDAHRQRLKCSACHAAWSFQDYGLHLMLEERADYWKWATLSLQNDPQVQELLRNNVGTYADFVPPQSGPLAPKPEDEWSPPVTKDWLTGERRPGAWFRGYTARRWSRPPLGKDGDGRICVMRPMYQYVISHVGDDHKLLKDRQIPTTGGGFPALIFNPYGPHTISSKGRSCHECHGNTKAAGLGQAVKGFEKPGVRPVWEPETQIPGHVFRWDALVDEKGQVLQHSSHPSAGPLDAHTIQRLLNPSEQHRAAWYKYLKPGGSRDY